jgi:virulence factor Mce-like protein
MSKRRGSASIVASPVLVGAVTVLIVVVSVFLAYNANQGLPFVPTYDLSAETPGAANLVRGNEVRVGGFRVGVIDKIRTRTVEQDGKSRAIAVLDMKLDKVVEPLPVDTRLLVRPRSALGLKYVELTPGQSKKTMEAGDTLALGNATAPVEFDDFLATFDQDLRDNSRTALEGFGDALAGRGASINAGIDELPEFFEHLGSVMSVLNDPDTGLDQFFLQIGRASKQVAPVADVQADLFENMADTFEAFSANPEALRQTIAKTPPTLEASSDSFEAQTPFLIDFTDLSRRLRPTVRTLDAELPGITRVLRAENRQILRDSVLLNRRTEGVFRAIDELASDPNTKMGLEALDDTLRVTAPLVSYVAPYQTVCNTAVYFFATLGNHFGQVLPNGAGQRAINNSDNGMQDNRTGSSEADRPSDVPANEDPQKTTVGPRNLPATALHGQPYGPAIDGQGNADCQNGQTGYLNSLAVGGRYPAVSDGNTNGQIDGDFSQNRGGGSHVVGDPDTPGNAGGTYISRKLGIDNLDDVDRGRAYHRRKGGG